MTVYTTVETDVELITSFIGAFIDTGMSWGTVVVAYLCQWQQRSTALATNACQRLYIYILSFLGFSRTLLAVATLCVCVCMLQQSLPAQLAYLRDRPPAVMK